MFSMRGRLKQEIDRAPITHNIFLKQSRHIAKIYFKIDVPVEVNYILVAGIQLF